MSFATQVMELNQELDLLHYSLIADGEKLDVWPGFPPLPEEERLRLTASIDFASDRIREIRDLLDAIAIV